MTPLRSLSAVSSAALAFPQAGARRVPFRLFWNAIAGRIGKQERAAPTGDPLNNDEENAMLNLIKTNRAEQEAPLFSTAHTTDARRAQAWLEAQFRRAERTGGFTLDDVEITPVLAEVMLTSNTHNRTPRRAAINRNRQAIRDGRWVSGASTIRFDMDRTVADGQHRLIAVMEEARPITVDVRFGVSGKVRPVLDMHGKRSGSDVLAIEGHANTSALAAAARLLHNVEIGAPRGNQSIDNDVCAEFVDSHPGLRESTLFGLRINHALKCSTAAGTVAHHLIAESGAPKEAIELFLARVCDGLGLTSKRDPIYVLRDTLREGGRAPAQLGAIINAWNLHKRGKKAQRLTVPEDQPFPTVEAWG